MTDETQGTVGEGAESKSNSSQESISRTRGPDTPEEMAKILEEIKLPARKDFRAGGDAPVRQIPTALPDLEEKAPTTPAPEPQTEQSNIVPLHTLKDDLQNVVRVNKISVVKAAALESERRAKAESLVEQMAPERRSNTFLRIVLGLGVLTVLAGATLFGVYYFETQQKTPTEGTVDHSLLFAEQTFPFPMGNLSARELKNAFLELRTNGSLTLGAIVRLSPQVGAETNPTPATTREFLTALGSGAPDELLRALESQFFFGFHAVDENAPVLVIPVNSYERAFAGMLEWEKTMNSGLSPLFTPVVSTVTGTDGIPTQNTFKDIVMRNYDVRALYDTENQVQLYYAFPTRNVLIIAESPYSFVEILSRLRAERRI